MSIEADLFAGLKTLVANRVYPETFIQPNGALPVWPAIRYSFVSIVPTITICGDGGDETANTRLQIDVVDKTFIATRSMRLQVMQAMLNFDPPAIVQNSFSEYDVDTKTFRASIDYVIYKSTVAGSP